VLVVVFAATHALSLTLHAGGSPPDLYLPAAGWSTFTGVIALVLLVGLVVTSLVGRLTHQTLVLVRRRLRMDLLPLLHAGTRSAVRVIKMPANTAFGALPR
jgi:hypothetical protein